MSGQTLWFPYAQMQHMPAALEVESAQGVYLNLKDGRSLIDATSSWWCMIHGYRHPQLDQVLNQQINKVSHVMMGGLYHDSALQLADKLVEITPNGLNHVFYGDSGSVGVEIALKLAMQYWQNRNQPDKNKFLSFKKGYHGDTTGCMSVCDPDDMHRIFAGIISKQYFAPAPNHELNVSTENIETELLQVRHLLETHADNIAAVIIEPLLQAVGGFNFFAAEYLNQLRTLCDEFDVLLIFDEVATGFGRTGSLFATDKTTISPDIIVLGKALTAGYLGHSATLSNERVYEGFLGESRAQAFMHGPTFMGNPLACAVALKSIELFFKHNYLQKIKHIEACLKLEFANIDSSRVVDVRVLGAIAVVELETGEGIQDLRKYAADRGVWIRPFAKYIYTMPPYIIEDHEIRKIASVIQGWLKI